MEYLDFADISARVPFQSLLDHLNIPYTTTETELKGEGFVISREKNLYKNPTGEDKGSVINFLAAKKALSLREAASQLKSTFLAKEEEKPKEAPALPYYELTYH